MSNTGTVQQLQQSIQAINSWDRKTVTPQFTQAIQHLMPLIEQPQVLQAIERALEGGTGKTSSHSSGGNS